MSDSSRDQAPVQNQDGLTGVLGHNERAQSLLEECADELASVNDALTEDFAEHGADPAIQVAIERSEAIEIKVGEASRELSIVNQALEHEVRERQALEHQLSAVISQAETNRRSALHDVLTGLPNRSLFNSRLEQALLQAGRHKRTLAVMFLDLDGFKTVNDSHGHEAGDLVLRTVAARLKETVRAEDTICRHGGDEFLCLLTEIPDNAAIAAIARKLIDAIRIPFDVDVRGVAISQTINASIGIAVFPRNGTTPAALIASADEAMYAAKKVRSGFVIAA